MMRRTGIRRTGMSRTSSVRKRLDDQRAEVEYHSVPNSIDDDRLQERELSWGEQVLESSTFMNCMGIIILGNGAVIGLETDFRDFEYWDEIEAAFLFIFLGEVIFKMGVEGWLFFHPHEQDFLWNLFDIGIVGLGLFDLLGEVLGNSGSSGFATIFRMVRLLRVLRIFRLLKVLKPLFLLAVGLIEACKAIIWVSVLMGTVLYVFAIVLVKTVGKTSKADPHYEFLVEHFRTIPEAMITLFVLMSSPNLPIYQEEDGLLDSRPFFCIFLIMFICFGSFGMIAMLTGVINESMFENNELRKQEKKLEHELMRASLGKRSVDLYETLPLDADGYARVESLKQIAEPAAELLDQAGVEIAHGDVLKFLQLMDDDESGKISMKDFVFSIEKMAEGLSPLSIVEVQHYLVLCNKKLSDQLDHLAQLEDKIEEQVGQTLEEVDRILKVIIEDQGEHRTHLASKIESQIGHTSEEVDRILNILMSRHNEHQEHLAEKIESQMQRTSDEVDRILQVVTEDHNEHRSNLVERIETQVMRIAREVERIFLHLSSGDAKEWASSAGDPARGMLATSETMSVESTVRTAVSKQTEDVAAAVQSVIDRKFVDLERQLGLKNSNEKHLQVALSSQIQDLSTSLQKLSLETGSQLKQDEILSSLQDLSKKEEMIESLRFDLARLMQESKNSVVRVAKAQETIKENFDTLSCKITSLEKHSDAGQASMLNIVADLRGDIINSLTDLVSSSLSSMKQEAVLQRFHDLSSLSRENTVNSIPDAASSPDALSTATGSSLQPLLYHSERMSDRAGTGGSPQRRGAGTPT